MEDPAEATVMCPYHPAHKILVSRYQTHLSKCKAQNSHMDTVSCPFNATHVVSRAELNAHIRSCPDRATVDSFIVEADTAPKIAALLPVNNLDTSAFPDESWDDQVLDVSVIDQVKTDAYTKNVLITKVGASKAERKLHRENERLRHQQVLSQIGPRAGSSQQNQDSQNPQPPKSQLPGAWSQPSAAKGPGKSDLDDAVGALSISSNDTKQSEPAPATKPSAWGKPFARDHSAVIAAPNFGPSTGPSGQVSGRPKADPWNRKTQPPPAPAAEKPSSEPQRQPVQQRGLGSGSHAPNGAWSGGNLFAPAAVGINQDDFPYLMPTSSRGRRARP